MFFIIIMKHKGNSQLENPGNFKEGITELVYQITVSE